MSWLSVTPSTHWCCLLLTTAQLPLPLPHTQKNLLSAAPESSSTYAPVFIRTCRGPLTRLGPMTHGLHTPPPGLPGPGNSWHCNPHQRWPPRPALPLQLLLLCSRKTQSHSKPRPITNLQIRAKQPLQAPGAIRNPVGCFPDVLQRWACASSPLSCSAPPITHTPTKRTPPFLGECGALGRTCPYCLSSQSQALSPSLQPALPLSGNFISCILGSPSFKPLSHDKCPQVPSYQPYQTLHFSVKIPPDMASPQCHHYHLSILS